MPIEQAQSLNATRLVELQTQLDRVVSAWPKVITLEIGCGHGHFLDAYAAAHPDEYCVGVDIIRDRLERAARKVKRAGSTNTAFLLTDAVMFLENMPADTQVGRTFMLFPDPWPKRRHHKNRLMSADFLALLARKSTPDAQVYFRTDHGPYFEDAQATLRAHPDWVLGSADWPFERETVFQSRADSHQSFIAKRKENA